MWNNLLDNFLSQSSFVTSEAENCVYVKVNSDNSKLILISWVDVIIIAGSNLKVVEDVKSALTKNFKTKDFGIFSELIGMQFVFDKNEVKIHQSKYAEKVLTRFNMTDCNVKSLPCDPSFVKIYLADYKTFYDNKLYRQILGSLVYLMSCTRPDLCCIVAKLSENLDKPTVAHYNACKHVLRYLKNTIHMDLIYFKCDATINLTGWCDVDWDSSSCRKSLSGCCFQIYSENSYVSWKTKTHPTVA